MGINQLSINCRNWCSVVYVLTAMALGSSVEFLATNDPDAVDEERQETKVYDKHDKLLHGSKKKSVLFILSL